jgi:hypothetical protein
MSARASLLTAMALDILLFYPALAQSQVSVISEVAHDMSPPLSSMSAQMNAVTAKAAPHVVPLRQLPLPQSSGNGTRELRDNALQRTAGPLLSVSSGVGIDGIGTGFSGPQGSFTVTAVPPDTNGAVGDTQYVQWVNSSFAVFSKSTGAVIYGPALGNTLWQGFGGQCQSTNDGDPVAQYDKIAKRWVMSQFSISGGPGNFFQCIAVSVTSDATGSYYRYAFSMPNLNDYPKLGVWPDAYYASFNMFTSETGPLLGARACAFDRSKMLIGASATAQCFQLGTAYSGLLPSDLDGSSLPPSGSPNYYLNFGTNSLNLWKFHVDFSNSANSTFLGPTSIPVAAFTPACNGGTCIPQPGTTQTLASLGDRLMYRLAYRNFRSHESLVVNHSIVAGSSVGIRWYELRGPGGTPTLYQQGTYAPDSTYRWMGSIAMDSVGNMAVGYSASSSSVNPAVRYTGRLATDALGTLEAENSIMEGAGAQTSPNRWGDYSSISVDPVDDCTFWYTNEYLKGTGQFNWSTRIGAFKFPNCHKQVDITPIIMLLLQQQGNSSN